MSIILLLTAFGFLVKAVLDAHSNVTSIWATTDDQLFFKESEAILHQNNLTNQSADVELVYHNGTYLGRAKLDPNPDQKSDDEDSADGKDSGDDEDSKQDPNNDDEPSGRETDTDSDRPAKPKNGTKGSAKPQAK